MSAVVTAEQNDSVQLDTTLTHLPTVKVKPEPGANPRKFFGPEQEAMNESVAQQGIIQPLVVRPDPEGDGGYIIIAGERRWRAAMASNLAMVPVLIRDVNEREAYKLSVTENIQRQDMSPAEEAEAAREVLELVEGDRPEAQRLLGWSESKLEGRLRLLHCTADVLTALTRREIKVGHAELLSGLPGETQDGTLKNIIDTGMPVSELAARVAQFSLELADAIFDKADCQSCPHNSSEQSLFFDHSISEGRCTNRACYFDKTQQAIEARRTELADDYNKVALDTEVRPDAITTVVMRGPEGVGPEQLHACKGCASYGAVMHTDPGREGQVREGVCFDLTCHKKKVKAFRALFDEGGTDAAQPKQQASAKASGTTAKGKTSAPKAAATPRRVKEYGERVLREALADRASRDTHLGRAMMIALLIERVHLDKGALEKHLGEQAPSTVVDKEVLPVLAKTDAATLDALQSDLVAALATESGMQEQGRTDLARHTLPAINAQMSDHFTLNADYLKAHTKAGIEALLVESGFDADYERREGEGAFSKLMKRKVDEIVQTVLDGQFDFTGFVPQAIRSELADRK